MGPALAHSLKVTARPLFICAAAALTCACADLPAATALSPPPIDANSPVAQDVKHASEINGPFPRFSSIPDVSKDIRPTRAWTRSIYDTLRLRRLLLVQTALVGPAPTDTEEFYQSLQKRAVAPASPSAVAAAQLDSATDAFVKQSRQRATPPSSAR